MTRRGEKLLEQRHRWLAAKERQTRGQRTAAASNPENCLYGSWNLPFWDVSVFYEIFHGDRLVLGITVGLDHRCLGELEIIS